MNERLKQVALIGATACGKSELALKIAKRLDAYILSIDSLAIYKEIDIASAKPSKEELAQVPHFGIDLLLPNEHFSAVRFISLYKELAKRALRESRPLILVGGSSFYLKTLIDGISPLPRLSKSNKEKLDYLLRDLHSAYSLLQKRAPKSAAKISSSDRYRIQKYLTILLETGKEPLEYFKNNPPRSILSEPMPIYELYRERGELRERIAKRTKAMLLKGLIDEVAYLEWRYTRAPQSMKAIGIVEVLDYLDGRLNYSKLEEKIATNTARLAKRQNSFNKSQFKSIVRANYSTIYKEILKVLES